MSERSAPSSHPELRAQRAARRRALLTALVFAFTASAAFLVARMSASPVWLRLVFLGAEFACLGVMVSIVRRHWKRQDELERFYDR
jgi:hypothetical protein